MTMPSLRPIPAPLLFLLFAAATAAAETVTDSTAQALALLTGVSARDHQWTAVLNTRLTIDRTAEPAKRVTAMLDHLAALEGQTNLRAQRVISHLVADRGATGSELMFGVHALGAAVWCELTHTVRKHAKFAAFYARKVATPTETTRWYVHKIQSALPGYVDKLAAIHEPFDHLQAFNDRVNDAIKKFDEGNGANGKTLADGLTAAFATTNDRYLERCAVKPSPVAGGQPRVKVADIDVMKLIGNMESFDYVDFATGMQGTAFWKDWLKIKPYVPVRNDPFANDDEDVNHGHEDDE